MSRIQNLAAIWQIKLQKKNFRNSLIVTLVLLASILFLLAKFLTHNELRRGFSFNDPLLKLFAPVDVTWLTFGLIYLALIIAFFSLTFHPEKMLLALQSYTLIASMRIITIYFLPLNAPPLTIPLKDPFVELFGNGETFLHDLFFSGHTSTMFLLFLTTQNKRLKSIFLICTILVASCVLIQHVHYTIDVIAAPFFAYTCYRISYLINSHIKNS
ncbi:MAG: phosphatase PAP2-related protein [Bacteroidota bacterium]